MGDKLTAAQRAELDALRRNTIALRGGRSFLMRSHWHESGYQTLVRRGLVQWGDPPEGMSKRRFAGVRITASGLQALQEGE